MVANIRAPDSPLVSTVLCNLSLTFLRHWPQNCIHGQQDQHSYVSKTLPHTLWGAVLLRDPNGGDELVAVATAVFESAPWEVGRAGAEVFPGWPVMTNKLAGFCAGGTMKRWVFPLVLLTVSASFAFADGINSNDPYFTESGSSCANASWCSGYTTAVDPLSGIKTLMYTLNSSVFTSGVVSGDIEITEQGVQQGQVGDLIRFENVNGTYEVFIFSDDLNGGQLADVGLPSSFQSNHITIAENGVNSTLFTPTYGQAGYTGLTSGDYAHTSYELYSPADTPEPSSLLLFGTGLLVLAGVVRKVAM